MILQGVEAAVRADMVRQLAGQVVVEAAPEQAGEEVAAEHPELLGRSKAGERDPGVFRGVARAEQGSGGVAGDGLQALDGGKLRHLAEVALVSSRGGDQAVERVHQGAS